MLKKILIIAGIVVFLAGAGGAVYYFFFYNKTPEPVQEPASTNEFEELAETASFEDLAAEADNMNLSSDPDEEIVAEPEPVTEIQEVAIPESNTGKNGYRRDTETNADGSENYTEVLFNFSTDPATAGWTCHKISPVGDGETWTDDSGTKYTRTNSYSTDEAINNGCFAEFDCDGDSYYALVKFSSNIPSEVEATTYIIVDYDDFMSISEPEEEVIVESEPETEEVKPEETQNEDKEEESDTSSSEKTAEHEHNWAVCYNNGDGTMTLTCTVPGCSETKTVSSAECPPHIWPANPVQVQAEAAAIVNDYVSKYRPEFKYLCSNVTPYVYLYNGTYFVEYFGPDRSKWAEAWINSYTGKVLNVVKN